MTAAKTLYEKDFFAWSKQQAEALRAAARAGANQLLDWENLAEEIEGLGKSQRSALRSHTLRIIQHLTKLRYSPAVDPRIEWRRTIRLARIEIADLLNDNPSLRRDLPRLIRDGSSTGVELAIAELNEHGEIDAVGANVVRRASFSQEQVLGDWFPEEPAG